MAEPEGPEPVTELCSLPERLQAPEAVTELFSLPERFQGPGTTIKHGSPCPSYSMIGKHDLIQRPQKQDPAWQMMICEYKKSLDWKDQNERSFPSGERVLLAALYTEPVIIQKNKKGSFLNISVEELFKSNRYLYDDAFILKGNSGSGKSFIAQKIMLDWASEKHDFNFDLAFSLSYEEVKCISQEMNLIEILSWSCSLTSDQITMLINSSLKVLLIIDGLDDLDELRIMWDTFCISSIFQKAPPEVVVCSLLRQQFLPRSVLLITTRTDVPQGMLRTKQLLIVGFSKKGVKEYFQKFFQNEELFRRAYECVSENENLITACSIPVICWIICSVVREKFSNGADVMSGLETITSVYIDFVSTLLEQHCQGLSQSVPNLLRSLGQLAERAMLEQVLFDEKSVHETMSYPAASSFLCKLLFKRRIGQETMFSFMHHSFQEFFTALYYVLLDEDESKRKVKELLYTVERRWALSYLSDRDANLEISSSKLLQPVILFLCGLCKKELISTFFQKQNMAFSVNIETQLKEWIINCSQRYQNEHMLFILHCLYELHEKSFVGKVLECLDSIDLSNIILKHEDFWMLSFCFQNCASIRKLRLSTKSDNLKSLQSTLCKCEELWLKVDHFTIDSGDLISALGEGKILKELIIQDSKNILKKRIKRFIITSIKDEDVTLCFQLSSSCLELLILELTLTCSRPEISTIDWRIFLQRLQRFTSSTDSSEAEVYLLDDLRSVSGLKRVHLQIDKFTIRWVQTILSLLQAFPSLNELKINSAVSFIAFDIKQSLGKSLTQTGWTLTVWRKTVLIEQNRKSLTEEELKTNTESKRAESSSGQSCSEDAEVFTPECFQQHDEDKLKSIYRFVCPHAGQFVCSLTSLVFVMTGEGEVQYRIVSWDPHQLVGFDQRKPAGPLYSIDCFNSSISGLHLPHCEIFSENKEGLAVAHFTGGNVEIMENLQVNETHVMIGIRGLSRFGLLNWIRSPTAAQVLLFLQPITARENKLYVHLLPLNVPLSEVKEQHRESTYVKTCSKCSLASRSKYSLCCEPNEFTVQPETGMFMREFDPNYHPTFEVFVNVNTEKITLSLLDKTKGKQVWKSQRIPLKDVLVIKRLYPEITGNDADPADHKRLTEREFVKKHRKELTERVLQVMPIADGLMAKGMISGGTYDEVHAAKPRQEQMRHLLKVFDTGGAAVKAEFYRLLRKEESYLVDDLESRPSGSP